MLSAPLGAQQPALRHWTDEDGLPSMTIYSMAQDRQGYFWFTTDVGLYRWDGQVFKTYEHPAQISAAMNDVYVDGDGKLWAGSFGGQLFYLESDSLRRFTPTDQLGHSFMMTKMNRKGDVLVTAKSAPKLWMNGQWADPFNGDQLFGFSCNILPDGEVIGVKYDFAQKDIKMLSFKNGDSTLLHFPLMGLEQKRDGNSYKMESIAGNPFFLNTNSPEYAFIRIDGQWKTIHLDASTSYVLGVEYDPLSNGFWITSRDGAFLFDFNGKLMRHILKGVSLNHVLIDNEGNYWFSSLGQGLYQMPNPDILWYNPENSDIPDPQIAKLEKAEDGSMLISFTKWGAAYFHPEKGIGFRYPVAAGEEINGAVPLPWRNEMLVYGQNGNIAHLSGGETIAKFNGASFKSIMAFNEKYLILVTAGELAMVSAYPDELIASDKLTQFNLGQQHPISFFESKHDPQTSTVLRSQRCWAVTKAARPNHVWIAFSDDLYYWDYEKMVSQKVKSHLRGKIVARNLFLAPDGLLWVATSGTGVYVLRDTTVVAHFPGFQIPKSLTSPITLPYSEKGMPIKGFLPDKICRNVFATNGQAWVTTGKGLAKIAWDGSKPFGESPIHIETFDKADGLPVVDLSGVCVLGDDVWVGSAKGLIRMPKTISGVKKNQPTVHLYGIALWEKQLKSKADLDIMDPTQVEHFGYRDNNFRFDFMGFSWSSGERFFYKYRLHGLDTTWVVVDAKNHSARYPSLPPGNYQFEVVCVNEDGTASIPATYSFYVSKPYWRTWWFSVFCILAAMALVAAGFLLRMSTLRRRNAHKQEKAALQLEMSLIEQELRSSQMASLKTQMNPHFIFNALNSLQNYILKNDPRQANHYLSQFAKLMRMTLEMSNERVITLNDELAMLKLYLDLEGVRFQDNFQWELNVAENIDPDALQIPSMLIQPFVENAIKHGLLHLKDQRRLWINFELNGDVLHCSIRDNGVGRKRTEELKGLRKTGNHKSFASGATQKRLELLNYGRPNPLSVNITDLYSAEGNPAGTLVDIFIPVSSMNDDEDD